MMDWKNLPNTSKGGTMKDFKKFIIAAPFSQIQTDTAVIKNDIKTLYKAQG